MQLGMIALGKMGVNMVRLSVHEISLASGTHLRRKSPLGAAHEVRWSHRKDGGRLSRRGTRKCHLDLPREVEKCGYHPHVGHPDRAQSRASELLATLTPKPCTLVLSGAGGDLHTGARDNSRPAFSAWEAPSPNSVAGAVTALLREGVGPGKAWPCESAERQTVP